ncbi:histidine kinase dimerization/phospho-acceptor domain-containing protein, partial [Micromonospora sp. SL1-18]
SEERMRQFIADASHELRTPLTTIRGFAELYRQGAARQPEQTAGLLRRIEDEAARMGLLVEDLLLLARMDRERPIAL